MCFKWWFKLSNEHHLFPVLSLSLFKIIRNSGKILFKHDIKYNSFDSFSENLNSTIKRLKYLGDQILPFIKKSIVVLFFIFLYSGNDLLPLLLIHIHPKIIQ